MVGAFLADGARELAHVRAEVMSEEIGDAVARATFDAACKAADDGADVSPVTVAARLESMGALDLVGGLAGLDALAALARPGEREAVLERVKNHARVRLAATRAGKLAALGQTTEALENPDRYLASVAIVADRSRSQLRRGSVSSQEAAIESFNAWKSIGPSPNAAPLCIPPLDEILDCGLQPKRVYVIAARPGVGKSAAAVGGMYGAAALGHPSLMFSREMPVADIVGRGVVHRTGIDSARYKKGPRHMINSEGAKIATAHGDIARLPVEIDVAERDVGAMLARAMIWLETIARPLVLARAEHEDEDIRKAGLVPVIWIDYLQRCDLAGKFGSREEKISAMSDMLATFARDQNCALAVLCQINRTSAKENRPPRSDDLRESGAIEQDANVVILLHRDSGAKVEDDPTAGVIVEQDAIAIVDKNRHGATGVARLTWNGPIGRYLPRVQTYDKGPNNGNY